MRTDRPSPDISLQDARHIAAKLHSGIFTPDIILALVRLWQQIPNRDSLTAIVSDDASGRLVALVIRKLILKEREVKQNQPPDNRLALLGVAAGRDLLNNPERQEAVASFLQSHATKLRSTLIVTEFMRSGEPTARLAQLIKEASGSQEVAIATLATATFFHPHSSLTDPLYVGLTEALSPPFLTHDWHSGLATPPPESHSAHAERVPTPRPELEQAVRQDIDIIAEEVIAKIFRE